MVEESPGEAGPLSCVEGVSELFDGVVLSGKPEDSLLAQAIDRKSTRLNSSH